MVFQRKSKKRMNRKKMSKKNIHRGGQDVDNDEAQFEPHKDMFFKRMRYVANDIIEDIDAMDNDQVKDTFIQDVSNIRQYCQENNQYDQSVDETGDNFSWSFIVRCLFTSSIDDTIKYFENLKDNPKKLYDRIVKMLIIADEQSESSNHQEKGEAKLYYLLLNYMMEDLGWNVHDGGVPIIPDNDWAEQTIDALKNAANHFWSEGETEYDVICYICKNIDIYEAFIRRFIKMDEAGTFIFKDATKELIKQNGGNRRRRISRRKY